ncbi:hypothetical protein LTR97_007613 [Elasticomyces elasticus]|uniref:INO80 complex subunit B-like conserved region domain-containing protein n=1 Tax=Elasticomyces elasticus TaxID=574655 RepID=A0AAN7WEX2_9PEZI|nr:hypothetical protein LTR97_007613 [Elasticomyces elasticus]
MNHTYTDPHKRFKSADGTPVAVSMSTSNGAANLPAWTPPPAVVVPRGVGVNVNPARYQQQQQIMPPTGRTTRSTSVQPYSKKTNGRANSRSTPAATASISRSSGLIRLTVKAPPSKLRQATTGHAQQLPPNPYTPNTNSSISSGRPARTTRNPKRVVEEEDSLDEAEEEDGEDGGEGMMEVDEAEVDNELLGMADDDGDSDLEDAEGEEDDGMLSTHLPPPIIKQSVGQGGRPSVKVTAPPVTAGALKSVEAKEMRMEGSDDDEELSSLSENDDEDIDQTLGPDNDDDEVEEESADDLSEDDENSRSATPDLSKLTRRQRGLYVPEPEFTASTSDGVGLMALSNEALKKKVFSEEEHAMRRQEMARRRKMLSEKRGEEEKMETINKLLSKPAPKRRTRAEMIAAQYAAENSNSTPNPEDGEMFVERADAGFTRYVQNARGARLGVPVEWLEAAVGEGLGRGLGRTGGVGAGFVSGGGGGMVEEVV